MKSKSVRSDDVRKQIGDRVRSIFSEDYKYSMSEVGAIFGCCKSAVMLYYTGKRSLPLEWLLYIYRLGYDLNWLYTGEGSRLRRQAIKPMSGVILEGIKH